MKYIKENRVEILALGITIILALFLVSVSQFANSLDCRFKANQMGLEFHYGWVTGCMINVDGHWIDIDHYWIQPLEAKP